MFFFFSMSPFLTSLLFSALDLLFEDFVISIGVVPAGFYDQFCDGIAIGQCRNSVAFQVPNKFVLHYMQT